MRFQEQMETLTWDTTICQNNRLLSRSFLKLKVHLDFQFQQVLKKSKKNIQSFKQQVKFLHKIRKNASYVVRYLNLLQTNNHFYIVQEFCKGGNLKKVLMEKKLSVSEAFKYMRHILKGFMELIKKGILHANLSPQNILLHNGLMRLADFGLNLNPQIQSVYANIKNTVYLAPEVLLGKKYNEKSDIWSLGFIFYEMIYGCVPWKTGKFLKIYIQRLEHEVLQFPQQPDVSEDLRNLIRGCLQVDPQKRLEWDQIYSNRIFNGQFGQMESIDIKLGYILGNIRKSLYESNLDLQRYFQSKKITSQTVLNYQSFHKILTSIDPSIQSIQTTYLFELFDNNKTNLIEFSQFRNALQHFDISLEFKPLRRRSKKKTDQFENKLLTKEDVLQNALQKLVYQIKAKKIYDLYDIFIQGDSNFSGLLDYSQFNKLLRKIQPKLNDEECKAIYKKMDINNDNQLSFQEFFKSICVFTGSPYKEHTF